MSGRIVRLAHKAEPTTALSQRVSRVQRIVIHEYVRLARLVDQRVDREELRCRRVVVAVDYGSDQTGLQQIRGRWR